jgi:hypothetical protein
MNQPTDDVVVDTAGVGASAPGDVPDELHRWRCTGCGNMTRFDVVPESTTHEFWHLDLAGGATIEDTEVVRERVMSVACRWCGRNDTVEMVLRPGAVVGDR